MSFVIPFSFDKAIVRVVVRDEEPLFVASDVCKALAVKNVSDALSRLDDDEKGIALIDTLGGRQEMAVVNESGLYSLIMGSRKPEAKRFKKWVTAEVLPAIRKTGRFEVVPQHAIPQTLSEALRLAADLADQKQVVEAKLSIAAPKADALDRIATAEGAMCITDAAKCLQVAPKVLFAWMDTHGWTYRRTGSAERVGYSDKEEAGYLVHKVKTVLWGDGSKQCYRQVRVTPKGVVRLAEIFALSVAA